MQNELQNDTSLPSAKHSPLTRIVLERFTAFEQLDLSLGPGINVFIWSQRDREDASPQGRLRGMRIQDN